MRNLNRGCAQRRAPDGNRCLYLCQLRARAGRAANRAVEFRRGGAVSWLAASIARRCTTSWRQSDGLSTAGVSPSGKAAGFDPAIRRFESFHPSHGLIEIGNAIVDSETLALFSGNANAALAHDIARHLRLTVGHADSRPLQRRRGQCRDHGERARPRCVHRAAHLPAGQRSPDGTADDDRCLPARLGGAHHGGGALFRLRAPGPAAARHALADHGQAGGRHDRRAPGSIAC